MVQKLDFNSAETMCAQALEIQQALQALPLPPAVADAISAPLQKLALAGSGYVSVRSSATAEDTASAAFAGQKLAG